MSNNPRILHCVGGLSSWLSRLLLFWYGISRQCCLGTMFSRPTQCPSMTLHFRLLLRLLDFLLALTLLKNSGSFWSAAGDCCLPTNILRLDTGHWSYLVLLSSLLTGYQRVIYDYFELATHALPQQQLICCLDLDVDWCAHVIPLKRMSRSTHPSSENTWRS